MLLNRVVRSFNRQRLDYDFDEPMFEDVVGTPRLTSVGGMADSWEWTCTPSKTAGKVWTAPQRVRLNDRLRVEGWNPASGWSLWMVTDFYRGARSGFPVARWLCIGEGKTQFDSGLRTGDRMTLIRVRKSDGGFFWIPMGPRWQELRYGTKPGIMGSRLSPLLAIAGDGMFNLPESEMKEKLEGQDFFIKNEAGADTAWECENEVTISRVDPFGDVELYNLRCTTSPVGSILVPPEGTPLAPFKPDFEMGDEINIQLDGSGQMISVDFQPARFRNIDALRLGIASKTGSVAELGPMMESRIPISEIRPEMVLTIGREQGEWKSAAVFQPIEMTMTADAQRMYQLGDPSPYFMPKGGGQKVYKIRLKCVYGVMLAPGMTLEITPQMKTPPGAGVSLPKPEKPRRADMQAYLDKVRQDPYLDIIKRQQMEALSALRQYVADGPPRLVSPPPVKSEPSMMSELFATERRLREAREARQPDPGSTYTPQENAIFAIAKDLDEGRVPTGVNWPLSMEDMAWVTNNGIPTGYREVVAARLFVAQESDKEAQKNRRLPSAILNDPDYNLVGSQGSLMKAYKDLKTGRVPPSKYLPLGPNTIRKLRGFVSDTRSVGVSNAAKYILQMAKIPVSLEAEPGSWAQVVFQMAERVSTLTYKGSDFPLSQEIRQSLQATFGNPNTSSDLKDAARVVMRKDTEIRLGQFIVTPADLTPQEAQIMGMGPVPAAPIAAPAPRGLDRAIAQAYRKLVDEGFPTITGRPADVAALTMDVDNLATVWEFARSSGLLGRQAKAVLAYDLMLQFVNDGKDPADLDAEQSVLLSAYIEGEARRRLDKMPLDEATKMMSMLGPSGGKKPTKEAMIAFARGLGITVYAGDTVEAMDKDVLVDLLQGGLRYESGGSYDDTGMSKRRPILKMDAVSTGRAVRQVPEREARKAKVTDEGKVEDLRPPSNPLGKRKISWDD